MEAAYRHRSAGPKRREQKIEGAWPLSSPPASTGSSANRRLASDKAHPHMLRHACGYALANKGHDTRALQAYLGHRNIQHTVRCTELSPKRFKGFWRE